jgi:deazaflavin-dependent oxidoreductase (nitroreductase family)
MSIDGQYGASTWGWVAKQVEEYEASGGLEANTLRDSGIPIIVFTTVGRKSGLVRKVPLMRVEHDGQYALVASKGGSPEHPGWFHNIVANPEIVLQDGPEPFATTVREISGDERATWWERASAIYPPYLDYQEKTERLIPVFLTASR